MTHDLVTSPQGVTHYWTQGEGEAVVLLHGATMDHGLWQHQIEPFAQGFQVIALDLPAHGLSRPYADFSLEHAAEEVVRVLDRLGVDAAHLVGQSMGGYVAQVLAQDHPARLRSLVAVDSSPFDSAYYSRFDRWMLGITPGILRSMPYDALVRTVARGVAVTPEGVAYATGALQQLSKDEIVVIMAAVYEGLIAYSARRFTWPCPVRIVYGDQDGTGKVIDYSRRWAEAEGHPLAVIPDAGHNSNMDNPEAFNRVVLGFLAEVG
ncbi:MAG: alpha/beta hydrolase [Alphaproteobacteria bacterium]|nr:alpha/beta hydrolase [Alphaproteobacteria bacterium]